MTLANAVLRLALAVSGVASVACGLLPATFPPQFVHSNHFAAGPSWMMSTPSGEHEPSGQEAIGSAAGIHLQYERRLTEYLYAQIPFEGLSNAPVRIGPPDSPAGFSSLYFTPAVELRYPSNWWVQWCLSGGVGLARFNPSQRLLSGDLNPATQSETQWAPFVNFGFAAQIGAHWGIRADLAGRYVSPHFLKRSYNPASFSVVPVFIF